MFLPMTFKGYSYRNFNSHQGQHLAIRVNGLLGLKVFLGKVYRPDRPYISLALKINALTNDRLRITEADTVKYFQGTNANYESQFSVAVGYEWRYESFYYAQLRFQTEHMTNQLSEYLDGYYAVWADVGILF